MVTPIQIIPFQVLPVKGAPLSYTVPATGVTAVIGGVLRASNIDTVVHYITVTRTPAAIGVAAIDFDAVPIQPTGNTPYAASVPVNLLPGDNITVYADVADMVNFEWNGQKVTPS